VRSVGRSQTGEIVFGLVLQSAACSWGEGPPQLANTTDASDLGIGPSARMQRPDERPAELPPGSVASPQCQLEGAWMAEEVTTQIGLGDAIRQRTTQLEYWLFAQDGMDVTTLRHLVCDITARNVGVLSTTETHYTAAYRDALRDHDAQAGRRALIGETSEGACAVSFAEGVQLRGATLDVFATPAMPLPTTAQKGETPGAEDWDGDGHPGMTVQVTGAATGQLFTVIRSFDAPQGTLPADAAAFAVAETFRIERKVLGTLPASLPTAELTASPRYRDQYRAFLRLDDALQGLAAPALCDALRKHAQAARSELDGLPGTLPAGPT
jgi:hypothetical protein